MVCSTVFLKVQTDSTAQRSAAQHSTAQHNTAQHSTAQHSTAQHSTAQHSTGNAYRVACFASLLSQPVLQATIPSHGLKAGLESQRVKAEQGCAGEKL